MWALYIKTNKTCPLRMCPKVLYFPAIYIVAVSIGRLYNETWCATKSTNYLVISFSNPLSKVLLNLRRQMQQTLVFFIDSIPTI